MILYQWAKQWGVSLEAIRSLENLLGVVHPPDPGWESEVSEAAVQNRVRLEASRKGIRLWRNNVGATYTSTGDFIRYGLANESKGINSVIKSADLIGIRPITVTPTMVGTRIGQFVSREIKPSNWKYSATEREQAQLKWAELIISFGGDACFATGEGTL